MQPCTLAALAGSTWTHRTVLALLGTVALASLAQAHEPWLSLQPGSGPGAAKHIVLVSGDEEYRSEETLPQLAKILARHHGFRCTVLFAIDPKTGQINPNLRDNIPGLEQLETADLLVLFTRFRNLPDEQMAQLAGYAQSGRPIVALRTATHAFDLDETSKFRQYTWNHSADGPWRGGFGRHYLGETWVAHHGAHGSESTRGLLAPGAADHPILRGIKDGGIWGPTDVYTVHLPDDGTITPLVLGQVVAGMKPDDPPVEGPKNSPMMPIAWCRLVPVESGKTARVFTTTMGASQDLASEGLRRLLVNACYWALGLDEAIDATASVDLVGEFQPTPFRFGGFRTGLRPSDLVED